MPPRRAPPGLEHPRAEHGVGLAALERRHHVGEQLGRVLAVAVEQHDDVEAVVDRPLVAGLLVAAVAEVPRVADDLERQVVGQLLVAERHEVGAVLAGVVADEDFADPGAEVGGDAVEHLGERRRGVVGHDEDADALGGHLPALPHSVDGPRAPRA